MKLSTTEVPYTCSRSGKEAEKYLGQSEPMVAILDFKSLLHKTYTTFLQSTKRSLVISNEIILEMRKKMSLPIGGRASHHGFQ